MLTILAEAAAAQTPTAVQTYGPVAAVLLALGGWKGIAQGIVWLQGRNGDGHKFVPASECALRHEAAAGATAALAKSVDKLEGSISKLHERIDKLMVEKT
jgi:hypothetical protein